MILSPKRLPLLFLVFALALRLFCWYGGLQDQERYLRPDSFDYLRLADSLLEDNRFGGEEKAEVFRVPGYPLFLALCHMIYPGHAFPGLVQVFLDVSIVFFTWVLAKQTFSSEKAACIALGFQSLSIVSAVFACQILSETLYTWLLLLFLLIYHRLWHTSSPDIKNSLWCGLIIGLMAYVRAITLLYLFIPIIYLVLSKPKKWREGGIFLALVLLLLFPWYYRNANLGYSHFSSVGAINMYRYNACLLLAEKNSISYNQQQKKIDQELKKISSQPEEATYALDQAKKYILERPFRYVYLHMQANRNIFLPAGGEFFRMFGANIGGTGTLSVLHSQGIYAAILHYFDGQWRLFFLMIPIILILGTLYVLSFTGILFRLVKSRGLFFSWEMFCLATILYFILVPGGAAHPRFRVPISPLLALYAGAGYLGIKRLTRKSVWKLNCIKTITELT